MDAFLDALSQLGTSTYWISLMIDLIVRAAQPKAARNG